MGAEEEEEDEEEKEVMPAAADALFVVELIQIKWLAESKGKTGSRANRVNAPC